VADDVTAAAIDAGGRRPKTRYARLPVGFLDRVNVSRGQGADVLLVRLALSSARRTLPGVLRVGAGWLLDEIGWPETVLRRCLRELEDASLIAFDRQARVLHVRGLILADPPRSLSSLVACARDLLELPSCQVRDCIAAECGEALAGHALLADWHRMTIHGERHGDTHTDVHRDTLSDGHSTHARTRARPVPPPVPPPPPLPPAEAVALRARFEHVRSCYPRRGGGKDAAWRIFEQLRPDDALTALMVSAIAQQCRSQQWQRDKGRFIPHLKTWLERGEWQDEPDDAGSSDGLERLHAFTSPPPCADCGRCHPDHEFCSRRELRKEREIEQTELTAIEQELGCDRETARAERERRQQGFLENMRAALQGKAGSRDAP